MHDATKDFTKPSLLLRVAMKIHNACVDVHMQEEAPHPSDFYGGYDTPRARAEGAHRGQAQTEQATTSGQTHEDGSPAEEPTWTAAAAKAALPPEYVAKNTSKQRETQLKVSCARLRLTDKIAAQGLHRPDPEAVARAMRNAKRSSRA